MNFIINQVAKFEKKKQRKMLIDFVRYFYIKFKCPYCGLIEIYYSVSEELLVLCRLQYGVKKYFQSTFSPYSDNWDCLISVLDDIYKSCFYYSTSHARLKPTQRHIIQLHEGWDKIKDKIYTFHYSIG